MRWLGRMKRYRPQQQLQRANETHTYTHRLLFDRERAGGCQSKKGDWARHSNHAHSIDCDDVDGDSLCVCLWAHACAGVSFILLSCLGSRAGQMQHVSAADVCVCAWLLVAGVCVAC